MPTQNAANFGTGTSGQVLTSNGSGVAPTFQTAPSGGGWVKLNSQTISSSASVIFNNTYLTSTYKTYVLVFDRVAISSSTLVLTFSTDNGSSYLATGYLSGTTYITYNSATVNNINGTTAITIGTGTSCDGTMWLYNLATAQLPAVNGDFWTASGAYWAKTIGNNSTASINAIKIARADAANMTSGTITLYGLT